MCRALLLFVMMGSETACTLCPGGKASVTPKSMPCACETESGGWDGSYITLAVGQSKTTTPPAAYTAVLLTNLGNSTSTVLLTFGGALPLPIELPPETNTPAFFIDDFSSSNLNANCGEYITYDSA